MKTFLQYLEERLQNPVAVGQRAAQIYGNKEKYGKWLTATKHEHIPLKSYRAKEADSVFNRYDRVMSNLGGKDIYSPDREVQSAAIKKTKDKFEKRSMSISDLHPTQPFVRTGDEETLKKKVNEKNPSHVRVATHKGKHYILDGHHSIMAAKLRGDKTIDVSHMNLDDY